MESGLGRLWVLTNKKNQQELTHIYYIQYARKCSAHFSDINSLKPHNNHKDWRYYYDNFTSEGADGHREDSWLPWGREASQRESQGETESVWLLAFMLLTVTFSCSPANTENSSHLLMGRVTSTDMNFKSWLRWLVTIKYEGYMQHTFLSPL